MLTMSGKMLLERKNTSLSINEIVNYTIGREKDFFQS